MNTTHFGQTQLRQAEFIKPPNHLKAKVGSGGLDEKVLNMAEQVLQNNDTDFKPLAEEQLALLNEAIRAAREEKIENEAAIEGVIYPAMQLKAHGGMFHYPLVTAVAGILVRFFEVIERLDADAIDIANAHRLSLKTILQKDLKDNTDPSGKAIIQELQSACERYFNKYPDTQK